MQMTPLFAILDDGRKVHYERYLIAQNSVVAWELSLDKALETLYGGEDLSLPEKHMNEKLRSELARQWNEMRRDAALTPSLG